MNKVEYIIIINFSTKEEALSYMQSSGLNFSFSVANTEFFNSAGDIISEPESYNSFDKGDISISDKADPLPGELYIENGFLKYYKEI